MSRIPNTISIIRITLSIALFFLLDNTLLFLVVYILCGISDVADGYIARKIKAKAAIGAKLDSSGDFLFFGVIVVSLLLLVDERVVVPFLSTAGVVAGIRLMNLAIGRIKFKHWGIMHTLGNKVAGFILFMTFPICVLTGSLPLIVVIPVGVIAALSAIEEMIILLMSSEYDADRRSLFRAICSTKPTQGQFNID